MRIFTGNREIISTRGRSEFMPFLKAKEFSEYKQAQLKFKLCRIHFFFFNVNSNFATKYLHLVMYEIDR